MLDASLALTHMLGCCSQVPVQALSSPRRLRPGARAARAQDARAAVTSQGLSGHVTGFGRSRHRVSAATPRP
eukprot:1882363-Rhodomonas_salina.1